MLGDRKEKGKRKSSASLEGAFRIHEHVSHYMDPARSLPDSEVGSIPWILTSQDTGRKGTRRKDKEGGEGRREKRWRENGGGESRGKKRGEGGKRRK